ncbi:hypothetical protein JCM37172_02680 [Faecalimonas hominis]
MRKIWNKGHRIRASDKHLVYHFSIGTLLFVFVAVFLLLNIKQLISLPRTAQAQYDATQHLPLSQAKAGDLVFFHSTYNAGSYVTHVGIYVGNNQMYHAGNPIGYADLNSSYWQQHLIGAGRVKQ